ncbi:hypothetical protein [Thalassotalea atypica]|uniref:hypothetical protein n=1 Tax=Thalassotalea atypica TaxID=2054316 RepID=UPI002573169C|nr:hypothetical protein [Thalassotalea atypica]
MQIKLLLLILLVLSLAITHCGTVTEFKKPKIFVIMVDDLGFSGLKSYGGELGKSSVTIAQVLASHRLSTQQPLMMNQFKPS